jgi:D-alanine-D-alanine ligase
MSDIAVLFGGPSPEHDISVLTGLQAARALERSGATPKAVYWAKNGEFHLVEATLEAKDFLTGAPARSTRLELVARPDGGFVAEGGRFTKAKGLDFAVVVNACHGGPGEDGSLQAVLDLAGISYTGPSAQGAALGMDKVAFAAAVSAAGLPSLPRHVLGFDGPPPSFDGPYICKPRFGGSSIGIEILDDVDVARALLKASPHYRDGALLEPYLPDAIDLNIAVRRHPELAVSRIERPLRRDGGGRIYSYAEKYLGGGEGLSSAPRELPAVIDESVAERIEHSARRLAEVALVRGAPRIDFLLSEDRLYINEINTIPGAMGWYLWQAAGVSFETLLADMIAEARSRPTRHWVSEGADGSALRAAGSIAGKLA